MHESIIKMGTWFIPDHNLNWSATLSKRFLIYNTKYDLFLHWKSNVTPEFHVYKAFQFLETSANRGFIPQRPTELHSKPTYQNQCPSRACGSILYLCVCFKFKKRKRDKSKKEHWR